MFKQRNNIITTKTFMDSSAMCFWAHGIPLIWINACRFYGLNKSSYPQWIQHYRPLVIMHTAVYAWWMMPLICEINPYWILYHRPMVITHNRMYTWWIKDMSLICDTNRQWILHHRPIVIGYTIVCTWWVEVIPLTCDIKHKMLLDEHQGW